MAEHKKKSHKKKTGKKKSKSSHKTEFKRMAGLISKEWKKYNGSLSYPMFTKKMWKEHSK